MATSVPFRNRPIETCRQHTQTKLDSADEIAHDTDSHRTVTPQAAVTRITANFWMKLKTFHETFSFSWCRYSCFLDRRNTSTGD
jgi:hypothetical protein